MVSLMALYLLAIRIGEVRGRFTMDRAMEYRMDILLHAEQIEKEMPNDRRDDARSGKTMADALRV